MFVERIGNEIKVSIGESVQVDAINFSSKINFTRISMYYENYASSRCIGMGKTNIWFSRRDADSRGFAFGNSSSDDHDFDIA